MPELPEIDTVRRALCLHLLEQNIQNVTIRRADIIHGPKNAEALLHRCRIQHIHRHGKQLAIIGQNRLNQKQPVLCVHLGMTGSLRFDPSHNPPAPDKHAHVRWQLPAGRLVFRDPRRFGGLWTFPSLQSLLDTRWARLGPDALTITPSQLHERLAATHRPLKAALLDQTLIAGLGNIYVDEILFATCLSPLTPAASLSLIHSQRLVRNIRRILTRAIHAGGSTIRDYASVTGNPGRFQNQHRVYGRAQKPCRRCDTPLQFIRLAGRATVFCGQCQPPPPIKSTG